MKRTFFASAMMLAALSFTGCPNLTDSHKQPENSGQPNASQSTDPFGDSPSVYEATMPVGDDAVFNDSMSWYDFMIAARLTGPQLDYNAWHIVYTVNDASHTAVAWRDGDTVYINRR